MNNDLEWFSEERLKDMQKHVTAGMTLGHADSLLIRQAIDIVLAAKQAKPAHTEQDGWRLVPIEPTDAMKKAYYDSSLAPISKLSVTGYRALIAAATKPESEL